MHFLIFLKTVRKDPEQFSDHKYFNRFIDLTDSDFTKHENDLIERGYNYNINSKKTPKILKLWAQMNITIARYTLLY